MNNQKDGYTVIIIDHVSDQSVQLSTVDGYTAGEVTEAFARGMVALTFHKSTVKNALKKVAKEGW